MIKVRIFSSESSASLQDQINEWLKYTAMDKQIGIVTMDFAMTGAERSFVRYGCILMYKETEKPSGK